MRLSGIQQGYGLRTRYSLMTKPGYRGVGKDYLLTHLLKELQKRISRGDTDDERPGEGDSIGSVCTTM